MSDISLLTRREMDVLQAVAEGLSTKEAARKLGIRPRTVEMFASIVRRKLNARSRAHMITVGFRAGLLSIEQVPA